MKKLPLSLRRLQFKRQRKVEVYSSEEGRQVLLDILFENYFSPEEADSIIENYLQYLEDGNENGEYNDFLDNMLEDFDLALMDPEVMEDFVEVAETTADLIKELK